MADITPIGIDQTTGQQRPVASDDNVVDNIGDMIADPSTQPTNVFDMKWSNDQQFLVITGAVGPSAIQVIYQTDQNMPESGIVSIIGVANAG